MHDRPQSTKKQLEQKYEQNGIEQCFAAHIASCQQTDFVDNKSLTPNILKILFYF